MLLQRRRAEGSAAAHRAINQRCLALISTVTLMRAPMAARLFSLLSGEERASHCRCRDFQRGETYARRQGGASDFREEIFVSVVINVGESHTMAFVQLASARGGGDIHKILSIVIA